MGCRRRAPRGELVRLVRTGGNVALDVRGDAPGRGGYLCRSAECFGKARRRLVAGLRAERLSAGLEDQFARLLSEESE